MNIEYREIPELARIFRSYFPEHYFIELKWIYDPYLKTGLVEVEVRNTLVSGAGKETWGLEYARDILKKPKEMEGCIDRWFKAFNIAKTKKTDLFANPESLEKIN